MPPEPAMPSMPFEPLEPIEPSMPLSHRCCLNPLNLQCFQCPPCPLNHWLSPQCPLNPQCPQCSLNPLRHPTFIVCRTLTSFVIYMHVDTQEIYYMDKQSPCIYVPLFLQTKYLIIAKTQKSRRLMPTEPCSAHPMVESSGGWSAGQPATPRILSQKTQKTQKI